MSPPITTYHMGKILVKPRVVSLDGRSRLGVSGPSRDHGLRDV
jgi:hypothetical protein